MTLYYPREISGNTTDARPAIGQQLLFTFYERNDILPEIIATIKNFGVKLTRRGVDSLTTLLKELGNVNINVSRKESIRLYVPHMLRNTLSVTYEDVSNLAMSVATDLINVFSNKPENIPGAAGQFLQKNAGAALAFAPDILNKTLAGIVGNGVADSIMGGIKKTIGVVGNPEITTLFKNVSLRTFNFSYLFSPRDRSEAEQVSSIVNYFKESSLPGQGRSAHTLTFPREVEVLSFTSQEATEAGIEANTSNTNPYLFRTKRCVITDFDINYTPAGQHNVFSGERAEKFAGMPTQIEMNVVLKETEIITRNDVTNKVAY